jgi:hypothetical protein
VEIYSLTSRGMRLAQSHRAPINESWGVIFFLSKRHLATKEQILENVPSATTATLARLKLKRVIAEESGVNV